MVNYLDLSGDTVIKDCKRGEVTLNGRTKQVGANLPSHDIANSFNYVYPRLVNLYEIYPEGSGTKKSISNFRKNVFTLTGCGAAINLVYRTIHLATA